MLYKIGVVFAIHLLLGVTEASRVSTTGRCGAIYSGSTCIGSKFGNCCSASGWCGSTTTHCGNGCQLQYGTCTVPKQPISQKGRCGPYFGGSTCQGSKFGNCCSSTGWCGKSKDHCAANVCQVRFGSCSGYSSPARTTFRSVVSSRPSSSASLVPSQSTCSAHTVTLMTSVVTQIVTRSATITLPGLTISSGISTTTVFGATTTVTIPTTISFPGEVEETTVTIPTTVTLPGEEVPCSLEASTITLDPKTTTSTEFSTMTQAANTVTSTYTELSTMTEYLISTETSTTTDLSISTEISTATEYSTETSTETQVSFSTETLTTTEHSTSTAFSTLTDLSTITETSTATELSTMTEVSVLTEISTTTEVSVATEISTTTELSTTTDYVPTTITEVSTTTDYIPTTTTEVSVLISITTEQSISTSTELLISTTTEVSTIRPDPITITIPAATPPPITVTATPSSTAPTCSRTDAVVNPGFENDLSGNWVVFAAPISNSNSGRFSAGSSANAGSWVFRSTTVTDSSARNQPQRIMQVVTLCPGTTYQLSAQAKYVNNDGKTYVNGYVQLQGRAATRLIGGQLASNAFTSLGTGSVVVPAGSSAVSAVVYFEFTYEGDDSKQKVTWLDEVHLTPL
ncbi:hypothetical protein DPSP01_014073 [Paraphaeosphaeria sporulosa]